jgi:putative serine protease PepD
MTTHGPEHESGNSSDRHDGQHDQYYPTDHRSPAGPPPPAPSPYGLGGPAGPPSYAAQPAPQQPATTWVPQAGEPERRHEPSRGRKRFAAGVIAAALVVGGGAGVGGAAAWSALHDDAASTSASGLPQVRSSSTGSTTNASTGGDVEAVASKVLPSVVKINVSGSQGSGSGSGIILTADGQILTNNHVVELAQGGGTLSVAFNDGTTAPATVLGTDPLTDTALVQATGVSGLTPATLGTSGDLKVGQGVVAIGSPFGLESTVTSGIVSALDRPVDVGSDGQGNATVYPAIQTDAAINPGNSGGALTDLNGNVVGINSSIRTAGATEGSESGSIGLGFAIPIDEVLPIVKEMAAGQTPTHARLGVSVQSAAQGQVPGQQETQPATQGATVAKVNPGSTAEGAGIATGDVITKVDDHVITDDDSLIATIRSYRPGDQVTVTYVQGGTTKTAQLTLDSDASVSNS